MNTRTTGALLTAVLAGTIALAACGDQQAAEDTQGGYAQGWQPGRYVPSSQAGLLERADSGIRAELATQQRLATLPMDGWHGRLLDQGGQHRPEAAQATRYRHRFL